MSAVFSLRRWSPADVEACAALLRANIPRYFFPHEEAELRDYLADPGPHYMVVEDQAGRVVGSGGPARNSPESWSVCWMMVHPDLQGRGIGRLLTEACQDVVRKEGPGGTLRLDTSQHTEGFYLRLGFRTVSREADGYGPGMDRIEMTQEL